MRVWAILSILWAQALPDSLWFVDVSGDTTIRTLYRAFPGGWTAQTYRSTPQGWRLWIVDTFLLDGSLRLIQHLWYMDTAGSASASALAPYQRELFSYPTPDLRAFTIEDYDLSIGAFRPRRRVYLWGGPTRWDSVLSGWPAILGLGWSLYNGDRVWPFACLATRASWGDSLLVEGFDPTAQVFVEESGYFFEEGGTCDSLVIYDAPWTAPLIRGFYRLCVGGGRLIAQRDSFCTPTDCIAQYRFLAYDGQGKLTQDSVELRFYTPQGQPLGSASLPTRYQWDNGGNLQEIAYTGGRYLLWWGSQMVSLPAAPPPIEQFVVLGREIRFSGAPVGECLRLYDAMGRLSWQTRIEAPDFSCKLPEGFSAGLYFIQVGPQVKRVFLAPEGP
jgi:hypothetical protein